MNNPSAQPFDWAKGRPHANGREGIVLRRRDERNPPSTTVRPKFTDWWLGPPGQESRSEAQCLNRSGNLFRSGVAVVAAPPSTRRKGIGPQPLPPSSLLHTPSPPPMVAGRGDNTQPLITALMSLPPPNGPRFQEGVGSPRPTQIPPKIGRRAEAAALWYIQEGSHNRLPVQVPERTTGRITPHNPEGQGQQPLLQRVTPCNATMA